MLKELDQIQNNIESEMTPLTIKKNKVQLGAKNRLSEGVKLGNNLKKQITLPENVRYFIMD